MSFLFLGQSKEISILWEGFCIGPDIMGGFFWSNIMGGLSKDFFFSISKDIFFVSGIFVQ